MQGSTHGSRPQPVESGRRRRELLEAAERVVLRDGPQASMNAIAAEAGITKPILYRHFGDKNGLYRALAVRHTDGLLAGLRAALDAPAASRRERVEVTLDTYLAAIETRPQVYRFLMHPAADEPTAESGFDVGRHSAPLLRRLGEELAGLISARLDLDAEAAELNRVWGHGIVGMMYAAGDWWLRERPCSRQALVTHLADLLWGRLSQVADRPAAPGR
ncbi:TetR family transcriptional regulator [Streptomyces sp. NPDC059740]|uniref:TetR family transcriptional regulator n=1 Tax=Streptomyces sp. NPDC059740 TaxID=3346926 RepID=UPI00365D6C75